MWTKINLKKLVLCFILLSYVLNILIGITAVAVPEEWAIFKKNSNQMLNSTATPVNTEDGLQMDFAASKEPLFSKSGLAISIPKAYTKTDLALSIDIYMSDTSFIKQGQFELSSSTNDINELNWQLTGIGLKSGWNNLSLPFLKAAMSGGDINLESINWFRFYANTSAEDVKVILGNVKITFTEGGADFRSGDRYIELSKPFSQTPNTIEASVLVNKETNEWVLDSCEKNGRLYNSVESTTLSYGSSENIPYVQVNTITKGVSLRLKSRNLIIPPRYHSDDLVYSFKLWVENASALPTKFTVELSSNNSDDKDELEWIINSNTLKDGYNTISLPLKSPAKKSGEFKSYSIQRIRIFSSNPFTSIIRFSEMKLTGVETDPNAIYPWIVATCENDGTMQSGNNANTLSYSKEGTMPYVAFNINATALDASLIKNDLNLSIPYYYQADKLIYSLKLWVKNANALPENMKIELSSDEGDPDFEKLQWSISKETLVNGWNTLNLNFNSAIETKNIDLQYLKSTRIYGNFKEATELRLAQMEISYSDGYIENPIKIGSVISTENTDDAHPFGLTIGEQGKPTIVWGTTRAAFNYDVRQDQWLQLSVVRDMSQQQFILYVNGIEVDKQSAESTQDFVPTKKANIAANGDGFYGNIFYGKIGDVRVFSTLRTPEEILDNQTNIKSARSNGIDANTRGYMGGYFIREDIGYFFNKIADDSINNNIGIIKSNKDSDWKAFRSSLKNYFTIVTIPDMQILAANYKENWYKMAQWISDNIDKENIKFVTSVGDLTNSNTLEQWQAVKKGYDFFSSKVDYGNSLGNHDYGDWSTHGRKTDAFNTTFPYETEKQKKSFGGVYEEGKMDNAYFLLEINGIKYLMLNIEFSPRTSVLEWANKVVANYPDYNVFITVHSYMYRDGEILTDKLEGHLSEYIFRIDEKDNYNNGDAIWEKLVSRHPNIMAVLCGHVFSEGDDVYIRKDKGINGNTVYGILTNSQELDSKYFSNNGVGMLSIMRFSADGSKLELNYYSPSIDKSFRTHNQIVLDMAPIKSSRAIPAPIPPVVKKYN